MAAAQDGYQVSSQGYFVYCNGDRGRQEFNARLDFEITLIPYTGSDDWIEKVIYDIHSCLNQEEIPKANNDCEYCSYINAVKKLEQKETFLNIWCLGFNSRSLLRK